MPYNANEEPQPQRLFLHRNISHLELYAQVGTCYNFFFLLWISTYVSGMEGALPPEPVTLRKHLGTPESEREFWEDSLPTSLPLKSSQLSRPLAHFWLLLSGLTRNRGALRSIPECLPAPSA